MRTSHVKIEWMIYDEMQQISDEQLFSSPRFSAYLMDIAEAVAKRYERPVKIDLQWAPENEDVAYTDNRHIFINAANAITAAQPTKAAKADSLIGLLAHELGHINYTCFAILHIYLRTLEAGKFKPAVTGLNKTDKAAKEALQAYFTGEDQVAKTVIKDVARGLWNTLEDAYVEARISYDFPGRFAYGIKLINQEIYKTMPTLQEQMEQSLPDLVIMLNLLLQYCLFGQVKNPESLQNELWDKLIECAPLIDEAKYDDDMQERLKASSKLLLKLWPFVEEAIEAVKQKGQPTPEQEAVREYFDGLERLSPEPVGKGDGVEIEEALRNSIDENKSNANGLEDGQLVENPPRIPLKHTDSVIDGENGSVEINRYHADNGYGSSAHEINKLLMNMASEKVFEEQEAQLSLDLQAESDRIDYGNAHQGIQIQVNRMVNVPDNLIQQYQEVAPALNLIAQQLVKQVKAVLPQESGGKKLSYMGKRLEPRALLNKEGKYFRQEKLPQKPERLAVSLVVDESGSMRGERMAAARAASIILYQFCQVMQIPISVIGHTEWTTVRLNIYAEFESLDHKDCYRLMDMQIRGSNRDGAALRYAAERLIHQPESKKLLIILSDGQPCGDGYYGTAAEADIRGIVEEYTRKGIIFFAGAIGDDKPNIERIYKKGYLDMSDIKKLPQNLARLIQQYLI